MFYHHEYLTKKSGKFHVIWTVANAKRIKPALKRKLLGVNLKIACEDLLQHVPHHERGTKIKFSLYLCAQLMYGIAVIYRNQVEFLYEEVKSWKGKLKGEKVRKLAIDLNPDVDAASLDLSAPCIINTFFEFRNESLSANYRMSQSFASSEDSVLEGGRSLETNPLALYTLPASEITMKDDYMSPQQIVQQIEEEDLFGGAAFLLEGLVTLEEERVANELLGEAVPIGEPVLIGAPVPIGEPVPDVQPTLEEDRITEDAVHGLVAPSNRSEETPLNGRNGVSRVAPPALLKVPTQLPALDITAIEPEPRLEKEKNSSSEASSTADVFRLEMLPDQTAGTRKTRAKRRLNTHTRLVMDPVIELTNDEMCENQFNYKDTLVTVTGRRAQLEYMFLTPVHEDVGNRRKFPRMEGKIEPGSKVATGESKWTFNTTAKTTLFNRSGDWAPELEDLFHEVTELSIVERDSAEVLALLNETPILMQNEAARGQVLLMAEGEGDLTNTRDAHQFNAQVEHPTTVAQPSLELENLELGGEVTARKRRVSRSLSPQARESMEIERKRSKASLGRDMRPSRASSVLPQTEYEDEPGRVREGVPSRAGIPLGMVQEELDVGVGSNGVTIDQVTRVTDAPVLQARRSYKSLSPMNYELRTEAMYKSIVEGANEDDTVMFEDVCPTNTNTTVQAAKKFTLLLALLKQRKVNVYQEKSYGEIAITLLHTQ